MQLSGEHLTGIRRARLDGAVILQAIIDGIMHASVYILTVLGLTLMFGVVRVIHFARGECEAELVFDNARCYTELFDALCSEDKHERLTKTAPLSPLSVLGSKLAFHVDGESIVAGDIER